MDHCVQPIMYIACMGIIRRISAIILYSQHKHRQFSASIPNNAFWKNM